MSITFFVACFCLSGLAGLAALIRPKDADITRKTAASAFLNSGILGLIISLLWYAKYQDNILFLVGLCVLSGLGGMATIDMALSTFKKGGIFGGKG